MADETRASSPNAHRNDAPGERVFDLVAALRAVGKHWAIALTTLVFVALSVTFYTLGQKKIYQSSATVQFDPNPPRPLGRDVDTVVDMGAGSYWNNREYYETQYKIIRSTRVALAVVAQLNLHNDVYFLDDLPRDAAPPAPRTVSPEEAADLLRERLTVEPVKDSRLAVLRYNDADRERAQRILATLLDIYIEQNLDDALASTNSALEWLRTQLDKLKGDLEASETSLHEYKLNNNILDVDFEDQTNLLREEMKQLNDALTAVRTKREEYAARNHELSKLDPNDPLTVPASELIQSPVLQMLRARHEEAVRERDALLGAGKGENHPEVRAATERLAATRNALIAEIKNVQGAVSRDLAIVKRQEAGLAALIEDARRQAFELNSLKIEYDRLRRTKDNTEKLYQLVLERTKESDLQRMLRVNNIRVLDRPNVPLTALRPRVAVNIMVGILAGLLLGIGAALGRAMLDRTLKTPDEVERELGLPFLGLLPEFDRRDRKEAGPRRGRRRGKLAAEPGRRELIVHDQPTSGIAEAARAIRTNLLFMSPDRPYKTLLIASAGPSEGKTTVCCCIAVAMAQAGQRVVLIDCDLRRPRLHRIFGKGPEVGVTSALLDDSVVDDEAALRTEVENLYVIPAGPIPPNPAELLHSDRFKALLRKLQERFDRVIIDSPPIVAVTDGAVLSTQVDGAVLVVRAAATTHDFARHGTRSLQDVGGKVIGAVLNAVDLNRQEYGFYHYYGYKKDGYYQATPEPAAAEGGDAPPPPLPN
ncbi:capsular polysaccharide biosynthesis protein [Sorangium cellulosum]|uniref:non-specific protein-tyrosine kinase n=1 Tax=Sorangium cellulosum TaxID=56 RepID=A0A4P2Q9Q8_SORCE|nr:polysaccharide biosynthesis tyrosine autokinase [Sorangium cellulosum]AUX25976.1 capsular polysaccharide biosynthesis protein [Sorangium cellulosum]